MKMLRFLYYALIIIVCHATSLISQTVDNSSYYSDIYDWISKGNLSADKVRIINLGPKVNTKSFDYAPTVTPDGKTLYFVSDRKGSIPTLSGDNSHDFWALTKSNPLDTNVLSVYNIYPKPTLGIKGINTPYNEGAGSISSDGKQLFFTGCNRPDGFGDCDIYLSKMKNGEWGEIVNLGKNVNSKYWDSQPSVAPYNSRIYFASTRPGPNSKGSSDMESMDIWYCDWDYENQDWKPAKNLKAINTGGRDCAPFIASDGVTLFFSSNGYKPNYGGLDFYVTKYNPKTDTWSEPVNLGKPINTADDELFLSIPASGSVIYFSSKRTDIPGSQGSFDLYMAILNAELKQQAEEINKGESTFFPNPFSEQITIQYTLAQKANVRIEIYNVSGELIRSLFNGYQDIGDYKVVWNGRFENGAPAESGTYIYKVILNDDEAKADIKHIMLVR